MAALDEGREHTRGLAGPSATRLLLLVTFFGAAIIASQLFCGLLVLIFGPLPTWLRYGIHAVEMLPTPFLAGAVFLGGEADAAENPAEALHAIAGD